MLLKKFEIQLRKIHYTKTTRTMKFTYQGAEYDFDVQGEIDNATKKLKKENKKLKEKIICLESDACNEVSQAQYDDMEEDFKEEIKKLKEENKKLAELHNIATTLANSDNEYLQEKIEKLEEELERWMEESMDMREELKVITDKLGNIVFDAEGWEKDIINKLAPKFIEKKDRFKELFMKEKKELKKLKEEIKKLKEEEERLEAVECVCVEEIKELKEDIEKLKKENNKLKEESDEAKEFLMDLGDIIEEYGHSRDEQVDLFLEQTLKENKKLKEENNKLLLKETQTNNENVSIKSEIEELKEYKKKIVNFKKMLKDTTENDSDYDTWDIIEKTLKINASGNDIDGSDDVVDETLNLVEYYKFIVHTLDPKCNMVNDITKEDIDDYTSDAELAKVIYKEFCLNVCGEDE